MDEAILFSIKIDQTDAIKQTAELTKDIDALVAKQKELDAAGEKNSVTYAENAALIRGLKKEQSDMNRFIDNSVKSFNAANGSINQQRANLSLLTQGYNQLSKEERDNENVGGKLQKQIKALSDELKKNEGAIGDNRRNVGGYQTAIEGASKSLNLFGVDLGALKDGLETAKNGIDFTKKSFSSFNGVLKASFIGVILLLVTGLIAAFTKFEPIMDKLNGIFSGLNAVLDVFVERLTRVGRGLVEIFSGNFAEGIDMVRDSFDGMGTAMANNYTEAVKLAQALDDLGDRQLAQIVINAEAKKSIDQLLLQSKNRGLSEKERLKLLDQAGKLERANFEQNKKIKEEEYRLALKDAKLKTQLSEQEIEELLTNTNRRDELEKRLGTLNSETLKGLAEKKAAIIQTENETINVEEKIANRRSQLFEQLAAEEAKRAAQRKAIADAQQKIQEQLLKQDEDFQKQLLKDDEDLQKRRAEQFENGSNAITDLFKKQELERLNALLEGTKTAEQIDAERLAAKEVQLLAEIELNKTFFKDVTDLEIQLAQTKIDLNNKLASDAEKLAKTRLDVETKTIQGIASITSQASQLVGEQTQEGKDLAIASTTIATYESATKAFNSLAEIPIIGPALGSVAAALAVASGLANVQKIASVDVGGAAAGGGTFYTKGPTMLMVGDNPSGREKITVEPISTRGKTSINRHSNLVKMAGGGTLISDGGLAMDSITSKVNSSFDLDRLLRNLPAPEVKVTEINRVNANLSKSVKVSQLK
jgi:hypothetical protein